MGNALESWVSLISLEVLEFCGPWGGIYLPVGFLYQVHVNGFFELRSPSVSKAESAGIEQKGVLVQ